MAHLLIFLVDLGVFRNPRYPLGKPYLKEYWKHVPISQPEEDVDSRNSLYMLRGQVLLSVLYPYDLKLREMYVFSLSLVLTSANMPQFCQQYAPPG